MLLKTKDRGVDQYDQRHCAPCTCNGTRTHTTFPIDSAEYKGPHKVRKCSFAGGTPSSWLETTIDKQILLKFVRNTICSYNVYGRVTSELQVYEITGSLVLDFKRKGFLWLYRNRMQRNPSPILNFSF